MKTNASPWMMLAEILWEGRYLLLTALGPLLLVFAVAIGGRIASMLHRKDGSGELAT